MSESIQALADERLAKIKALEKELAELRDANGYLEDELSALHDRPVLDDSADSQLLAKALADFAACQEPGYMASWGEEARQAVRRALWEELSAAYDRIRDRSVLPPLPRFGLG